VNKNSFPRGGSAQSGGPAPGGNDMSATLAPAPPPLPANAGPGTVPIQNSTPTMNAAPPTSGLADMRNAGPGPLPSTYGSSPQDIVNAAYGSKLPSDTAAGGNAYGDLIAASGAPAVVPQTGSGAQAPALAPPLTPRPSGIDRIPNMV